MDNLKIYLNSLENKIYSLSKIEQKKRNIYLRKIANGELQGPPTGIPSIDKEFLKYYNEEQIIAEMPKKTIYQYMMQKNENHLGEIALYYFDTKITYKKLDKLINICASNMTNMGVKKDSIVTICMPNTPEAVIAFYALNKIGAVANMIHPLSGQTEIKSMLNEVKSEVIITIDMAYNKILKIVDETNIKKIIAVSPSDSMSIIMKKIYKHTKNYIRIPKNEKTIEWKEFIKKNNNDIDESKYEPNKLSVILHTGGTTGTPKGVMLTDDNFNSMVEQFMLNADNFERGDKMLTIMPVFHGFGLCSSIHLPLSNGVGTILIPKLNAKKFDKTLKKYQPNHIIGVPTLFKSMLTNGKLKNMDLSYLKYVVSGGDLVKDSLESDINDFLKEHNSKAKLCKGYGLSEAVAGITFADKNYNKSESVGIPMVDTNIKIVSPGSNDELVVGDIGEICVMGPTIMKGYYNNKKETLESLKKAWLHTGDLGYVNEGILYFSQRKGNMIISSGVNVYPSNIEKIIETHDAVSSCAVIGIYHAYKIQVPKAYIILKDGYEANDEIKQEIDNLCRKNLNIYSIPYTYEFREKLPQTLLGKISHRELQEEEKVKTYTKVVSK